MAAAAAPSVVVEDAKDDGDQVTAPTPVPAKKKPSGAQNLKRVNSKRWALIPISNVSDVPKPKPPVVQENPENWFGFTPRGRQYIEAYWRAWAARDRA